VHAETVELVRRAVALWTVRFCARELGLPPPVVRWYRPVGREAGGQFQAPDGRRWTIWLDADLPLEAVVRGAAQASRALAGGGTTVAQLYGWRMMARYWRSPDDE
jgi:hypothetical protein